MGNRDRVNRRRLLKQYHGASLISLQGDCGSDIARRMPFESGERAVQADGDSLEAV